MTVPRFSLLVLLCLCLTLLAGQAFAASIYVSPTGNDTTGNGTLSSPYRTLSKAATVALPGDTVYARGGTYPATWYEYIGCSGTAGSPITFTNYPGEQAVFDGTGATYGDWDAIIGIENCSYVVVDGFEFKNALPTTLHCEGINLYAVSNVTVRNCIVHEVGENGIIVRGNNVLIENNEVYRAVLTNLNGAMGTSGWACGILTARTDAVAASNVTFRGNYVHDVWGEGINGLCSDGTIMEGNTVVDAYSVSYYLDNAKNAVVRNNVSYNTPTGEHRRNGLLPNGLLMATERYRGWTAVDADNIQVYNNLFQRGSTGISFWQDNGDYHNLKIYNNTIVAPEGAGVSIDSASTTVGNELKNNIIYGTYSNGDPSYWVTSHNDWPNGVPTIGSHPNSFAANPLLVNPVQTDIPNGFKLSGASPCINVGTAVGITTDYFGTTRDAQPDLGFHEYVDAPAPPVANFSGNPTSGAAPLTVAFTDLSSGSPTSWSWAFGDGGTSTAQSPSHIYNSTGQFTVSLTATNAYGSDGETKSNYITASTPVPPTANFTGNPTSGAVPLTVAFTDTSTGSPTSWSWTFGDGGTSTAQSPSHIYTSTGQYTVSLTATNAYGSDGETKSNYITASTGGSTPTFVAAGASNGSTSTIAPALPSGTQVNDILLLFVETANQAAVIINQNGGTWTEVTGSPQGTGTAGGADGARLTAFWSRYNGTQGAPTVGDSGDHQLARIIAIRGCATSGNPWDVTAGGTEATADTSGAIPGATTTANNTLVVMAIATSLPDASSTAVFSAWTNSDLASVTERTDDARKNGNGGGLGIATGEKALAGTYGSTNVTCSTAATKAMLSVALKP